MKVTYYSAVILAVLFLFSGCATGTDRENGSGTDGNSKEKAVTSQAVEKESDRDVVDEAVSFNRILDNYTPRKKEYNFYFTYKMVHPWWDAVAMGIEDAADRYAARGITINYEYLAPKTVSASDQKKRILKAAQEKYDVIGVDVAESSTISKVINEVMIDGQKVMTFSSSDIEEEDECGRIAYVGNTHNKEDGEALAKALCEKLNGKGKVGIIVGNEGAPCHEQRLAGAKSMIESYPDMEIVGIEYDYESSEKAYEITKKYIGENPDLAGMVCCNMVNPLGAVKAVQEAGLEGKVVIVGMDHDKQALRYLKEGQIYCLAVQDCYSIGFDTIQIAIKIADGLKPGDAYDELTQEKTTVIYQKDAKAMLYKLYGEE